MSNRPVIRERVVQRMEQISGQYAGLSLQALADASVKAARTSGLGAKQFSKTKLEQMRRGQGRHSVGVLKTLAAMLETTPEYLTGESDAPDTSGPNASALVENLSRLPVEDIRRFFDTVAERLIEYRPDQTDDPDLVSAAMRNEVSTNPNSMETFWDRMPRFYRREETRVRGIVFDAINFLGSNDETSSQDESLGAHEPSQEWLDAFRRHAPTASNDAVASLWAAILARECRHPGTISVRTLMTISGLPAHVFRNLFKFSGGLVAIQDKEGLVAGEHYIRPKDHKGPNHYLKYFDLTYDDVLELDEYGLVLLSHRNIKIYPETWLVYGAGRERWFMIIKKETEIAVNTLTKAAQELRPLYKGRPHISYLKGVHKGLGRGVATPFKPFT